MPRYARQHAPGALVHVIGRFVNHERRLSCDAERAFYLERLVLALRRSDWRLLLYGLMSTHGHLGLIAGEDPIATWLKPFHVAAARGLNRRQRRFGPMFAERATTIVMELPRLRWLAPYVHNNPVRAGVVSDASDSTWTSHAAWIGAAPAPAWLHVEAGLEAAGFGADAKGRADFAQWVRARASDPRDPTLSAAGMAAQRASVRGLLRLPVELSSPVDGVQGRTWSLIWRRTLDGDLELARTVELVAERFGLEPHAVHRRRGGPVLMLARRVVAAAAIRILRRDVAQVASLLGVSSSAVSHQMARADEIAGIVAAVARELRGQQHRTGDGSSRR